MLSLKIYVKVRTFLITKVMSCNLFHDYYDLKLLSNVLHPIDKLVRSTIHENSQRLKSFFSNSLSCKGFNDVTPNLVREFQNEAYTHVKHIREHIKEFGILYNIANDKTLWHNVTYYDYKGFVLIRNKEQVFEMIQTIANTLAPPNTLDYDATCLYLIYFYALLVNKRYNWIIIDYVNQGNRYNQYLEWSDVNIQDAQKSRTD